MLHIARAMYCSETEDGKDKENLMSWRTDTILSSVNTSACLLACYGCFLYKIRGTISLVFPDGAFVVSTVLYLHALKHNYCKSYINFVKEGK